MRLVVVPLLLLFQLPIAAAQVRLPIIDMHMHARVKVQRGPDGKVLGRGCDPQPCAEPAAVFTTDDGPLQGKLRGDGWTLELAPGWTLAAGERKGDFVLRKGE